MEFFYHYQRPNHPRRSRRSAHYHTVRLAVLPQVAWSTDVVGDVVNGIMAVGEMGRATDSEEAGETRFPNAGRSVVSKTMVFGRY